MSDLVSMSVTTRTMMQTDNANQTTPVSDKDEYESIPLQFWGKKKPFITSWN